MVGTYKQKLSYQINESTKNYRPTSRKNQRRPLKGLLEAVRRKRVNKWHNCMLAR